MRGFGKRAQNHSCPCAAPLGFLRHSIELNGSETRGVYPEFCRRARTVLARESNSILRLRRAQRMRLNGPSMFRIGKSLLGNRGSPLSLSVIPDILYRGSRLAFPLTQVGLMNRSLWEIFQAGFRPRTTRVFCFGKRGQNHFPPCPVLLGNFAVMPNHMAGKQA